MTPPLAHDHPAAARPRWRRILGRLPTVAWLTVMWTLLWGDASPGTVLAGAGVATVCYSVAKLPHIPVRLGFRPLRVLRLIGHFVSDLILSSAHVAFRVLWRPREANGAIVAVPMRTDSDLLLAMVSGGLSLITGSLVIELNRDQGVIYVHGMPIGTPEEAERLRRRVRRTEELFVRAFGTADDIAGFEAAEEEFSRE
ncbi:Na+/H+ antiporter subunit E [Nocardiopsis gilva YIM 90087]|uniref:Na+/H+ antiporter subunit E n=1 Tax=Nocardiopsis gilva YIM 90087 TaxID=1235441 RepID=A0A223S4U2_9ACTN|nr:Na+/H+ antiporter subunit E [Nocardiopsis gilva]ASU83135.1 Na+/H+ antiporter subunit E [Nocardiopsis gilva YIM 90087]